MASVALSGDRSKSRRNAPIVLIVSIIVGSYSLFFYFQLGSEFRLKENVLSEAYIHQYHDNQQLAAAIEERLNSVSRSLEASQVALVPGGERSITSDLLKKIGDDLEIEGSSVLITKRSKVIDSWSPEKNIAIFYVGSDLSQTGFVESSETGGSTVSSGIMGEENFVFMTYPLKGSEDSFMVAALPIAGLLSGIETKPYQNYFSEGSLSGIALPGVGMPGEGESFSTALAKAKASASEGIVRTIVYEDDEDEKIITAFPIVAAGQTYCLFMTSPVSEHLGGIQETLFVQRIQTFSLLAGTSTITIVLALFVSKNLRLDKEVRARTDELEQSNALIGQQKRDLEQAYAKLRQLDDLKDQFISVASHELKNPIQPILMYAQLAKRGSVSWEKAIDGISVEAKRLKKLADDILDVSRIESGSLKYRIERIKLRPLIEEIVASTRIRVPNEIRVELVMEDPEIEFDGDSERIAQVIQNIVTNSIKFTTRGVIKIDTTSDAKNVVIRISDTGTGIPEEILPTLFGKFVTKSIGDRNTNGTGLGLFICKAIVMAHGGKISAANLPEGGAQFTISLPLCNSFTSENGKGELQASHKIVRTHRSEAS